MDNGKTTSKLGSNEAEKEMILFLYGNNLGILFNFVIYYMSFLYFGNTPASVPPVFDTTPCMKEMLNYEDCVYE